MIAELADAVVGPAHRLELTARTTRLVLAAGTSNNTGGGGESKKSGPIGLVVIILLCIGCYFIFKSMSSHLRNVRENFPVELPTGPHRRADGSTADADKSPVPLATLVPRARTNVPATADGAGARDGSAQSDQRPDGSPAADYVADGPVADGPVMDGPVHGDSSA